MTYTVPPHTPNAWHDAPLTDTPLDAAHLTAAENDLVAYTQQAVLDLDGHLEGLIGISGGAQALSPTAVKAAGYTAGAADFVPVDVSAGSVTITLPSAPADKTRIGVKIVKVDGSHANTCTVARAGSDVFNVAGGSTSLTLSALFQGVLLQYKASSSIWYVSTADTPLNTPLGGAKLGTDGNVGGPGGSALAALSRKLSIKQSTDSVSLDTGPGTQYGAPASAPTTALSTGTLTGAYQYVYTEADVYGETPPSPASGVANPAGQGVTVTLPLPRKGVSQRKLYRTKANAPGTYYYLSALTSGGSGYFQTNFTDTGAINDAGLGANPPVADTTYRTNLSVLNDSVTYIRNTPGSNDASDLTILTSNPSNSGSYSIDSYGPIVSRNRLGHSFHSEITATGNGAHHLDFATISDTNPDVSAAPVLSTVLYVADVGNIVSTPTTDANVIQITQVASATLNVLIAKQSGDSQNRFSIGPSGRLTWGSGSLSPDATLERTAAQLVTASNNLQVLNSIGIGTGLPSGTGPSHKIDLHGGAGATDMAIRNNAQTYTWTLSSTGDLTIANAGGGTIISLGNHSTAWQALSFFGATPVAKQAITGALSTVTDAAAKAVLTSIIAALSSGYGLTTNSTT